MVKSQTGFKQKLYYMVLGVFSLALFIQYFGGMAAAAQLTTSSIRFSRMKAAQGTELRVTFTVPAGNVGTEAKIKVSFPDAYTVNTTGLTADSSSCGATGVPGTLTLTGDNTASQKSLIVGGVTNLTASTSYCVDLSKTTTLDPLVNAAVGNYSIGLETETAGNAPIDTTTIIADVITDDQIQVSAVVPASFTFVIDSNATSFTSNLSAGAVTQTTERTVTITSNATAGWVAWAKDSQVGLYSAIASKTIASTTPGTGANLSTGAEGYVLGVDKTDAASGGTVTVVPAYVGTNANNLGSGLDTSYRQIASANGTANGDVLKLYGKAGITSQTPAATDYTDTWTVVGAGSF